MILLLTRPWNITRLRESEKIPLNCSRKTIKGSGEKESVSILIEENHHQANSWKISVRSSFVRSFLWVYLSVCLSVCLSVSLSFRSRRNDIKQRLWNFQGIPIFFITCPIHRPAAVSVEKWLLCGKSWSLAALNCSENSTVFDLLSSYVGNSCRSFYTEGSSP